MNWSAFSVLCSVIAVDLTLAIDNTLVMGIVAGGLPKELRQKALLLGVCAAILFRILFASIAIKLLSIVGLTLAGGFLLLWVVWKIWQEIRYASREIKKSSKQDSLQLRKAVWQIIVADITMSLDNTLAVAGLARNHLWILISGLFISVALMGVASSYLAKIVQKHRWISYIGLAIVAFTAISMIWDGSHELLSLPRK